MRRLQDVIGTAELQLTERRNEAGKSEKQSYMQRGVLVWAVPGDGYCYKTSDQ